MTLKHRTAKQLPSLHSLNGAKLLFPLHSTSAYWLPWNLTWQQTSLPHRCIDLHNQRVTEFVLLVGGSGGCINTNLKSIYARGATGFTPSE